MIAKSPLGRILSGAILILALSPKARELARNFAIKGTELVLDVTDQLRETTAGMKSKMKMENEAMVAKEDLSKNHLDTMNMGEH